MKFLIPLTLLAAAGVSAQDKSCEADYIVTQCLSTETVKAQACQAADWDCLCAAYEAIATCYNNCPNDPRASPARGQVTNFCANASVYGSKAKAKAVATATATHASGTATDEPSSNAAAATTSSASHTQQGGSNNKAATTSSAKPTSTNAADALSGGAGGMFVAAAGIVAALL